MKLNLSLNVETTGTAPSQEQMFHSDLIEDSRIFDRPNDALFNSKLTEQSFENLQPVNELGKIFNCADAITHGDPEILGNHMDYTQGVEINGLKVSGNCGLDSSRNLLALCGKHYTEEYITKTAAQYGLCDFNAKLPECERGATTVSQRQKLLEKFGVEIDSIYQTDITLDEIADKLDMGHRGIISVNGGALCNKIGGAITDSKGNLCSTHVVTLLNAVREKKTNELMGFFICDSGPENNEPYTYVPVDKMKRAFTGVTNACVQMTKKSYSEIVL